MAVQQESIRNNVDKDIQYYKVKFWHIFLYTLGGNFPIFHPCVLGRFRIDAFV